VGGASFPDFMQQLGFDHSWRSNDELRRFLDENNAKLGRLLTSEAMRSVNRDRFQPLAFPLALGLMLALTLAGLAVQTIRGRAGPAPAPVGEQRSRWGWGNFALILIAVLVYVLCVETVGFVLLSFLLMMVLTCRLGARWWTSLVVAAVFSVAVYQLFAHLLRVPLPRGWLGW
jgi:putative tricarboxylic transport membrane protein